jgi:hypothetical protein
MMRGSGMMLRFGQRSIMRVAGPAGMMPESFDEHGVVQFSVIPCSP